MNLDRDWAIERERDGKKSIELQQNTQNQQRIQYNEMDTCDHNSDTYTQ